MPRNLDVALTIFVHVAVVRLPVSELPFACAASRCLAFWATDLPVKHVLIPFRGSRSVVSSNQALRRYRYRDAPHIQRIVPFCIRLDQHAIKHILNIVLEI